MDTVSIPTDNDQTSSVINCDNQLQMQNITNRIHKRNQDESKRFDNEAEAMILNEDPEKVQDKEDEDAPLKKRLKYMEEFNSENANIITTSQFTTTCTDTSITVTETNKSIHDIENEVQVPSNSVVLRLGETESFNTDNTNKEISHVEKDDAQSQQLAKRFRPTEKELLESNNNTTTTSRIQDIKMEYSQMSHAPHRAIEIVAERHISSDNLEAPAVGEKTEDSKEDDLEEVIEDEGEVYDDAADDSNDEFDYRNDYPDDDEFVHEDYGEGPTYNNDDDNEYDTFGYADDGEEFDPLKKFSALKLLDDNCDSSASENNYGGGDDDSDYDAYVHDGNDVDVAYYES